MASVFGVVSLPSFASFFQTEQPYKKNPKMLSQLQYCEDNGIPLAVILGESEIKDNVVKLRVVATREETTVPRAQLPDMVRAKLAEVPPVNVGSPRK